VVVVQLIDQVQPLKPEHLEDQVVVVSVVILEEQETLLQ
jgi:hypothetical protein